MHVGVIGGTGHISSSIVRVQLEVVPMLVEELEVQKRVVETGTVRLTKVVHEQEVLVDEPLFREEEIHMCRHRVETHQPQQVTLRREEVGVERVLNPETSE